jgi:pimeloyl-ACP methyl ester carboxylesterase
MAPSKLRYYRDKFAMRNGFEVPAEPFEVLTDDGVRIRGSSLRGRGNLAFLVVHGLAANSLAPGFREFAESLTRYGPVWSIDLRGHGSSGGECTLGNREAIDVAAAVKQIRTETDLPVILAGFSMGAGASVRAAALYEPVDGVVAISGPAEWGGWRGPGARRTSLIWRTPGGRRLMRMLSGVRIAKPDLRTESPADAARQLSSTPLLVVHGEADAFFPPEESRELFRAANEPKQLWLVEDGGHAEALFMVPGESVVGDRVDAFADEVARRIQELRQRPSSERRR